MEVISVLHGMALGRCAGKDGPRWARTQWLGIQFESFSLSGIPRGKHSWHGPQTGDMQTFGGIVGTVSELSSDPWGLTCMR